MSELPKWLSDLLAEFGAEADKIMQKNGLDPRIVQHLATTLPFDEFSEALDILMGKNRVQVHETTDKDDE